MSSKRVFTRTFLTMAVFMGCLLIMAGAQAQDTDIIVRLTTEVEPEVLQSLTSPDGSSQVELVVYPCTNIDEQPMSYERLSLIKEDENTLIAEQLINCGGLGGFGLWVEHWSESGTYLYYTDARVGVPDGLAPGWTRPFWRVHLPDLESQYLNRMQFSPDRTQLVSWEDEQITIMAVNSDNQFTYDTYTFRFADRLYFLVA